MVRVLRNIILWAIGVAVFSLIALLGFVGLRFFRPVHLRGLLGTLSRALLASIGVRVKVRGIKNIDRKKEYLIVCNHESLLDVFICAGYIPLYFVAVELDEHFSWPIWGWLTEKWGNIPITKGNLRRAKESLARACEEVRKGKSVIIFPEGERTLDGKLRDFKKGAFFLAKEAGVDILPVAISGLYKVKKKGDWNVTPGSVELNIGKPIPYDVIKKETVDGLKELVKRKIENLKKS